MAIPLLPQATVLSYKLFVRAEKSKEIELGQCLQIDLTESRDVTPNFVIGNDPPDEASHLIPGVVRTRNIRLRRVRLFAKSLREAFGRDDQTVIASLTDQNTPLDLRATIRDPNTAKVKTISWEDGFLSEVTTALTTEGDIREIESATFVYRRQSETTFQ